MLNIKTNTIAQIASNLNISEATAAFLQKNKTVPDNSKEFPRDTPIYDLINIKIKSKGMEPEDAYISVYVELGIRHHVTTADVIYV